MNLISLYTFNFSLKFNIIVISIYHKHIIYVLHNFFLLSFSSDDQFATFSHCSNKSKKNVMKNIFQTRHKKRKFFNNKKKDEEEKFEDDSKISSKSLIITHNNAMIIAICVYKSQHHKLCKKYTQ